MKTLIILVCIIVTYVQAVTVIHELIGSSLTECKEKTKATQEDMMQLLVHDPPTTTSAKCLVACLNKKLKIQTENGDIDVDSAKETLKLVKLVSEDMYQKLVGIVDKCASQVPKEDECEIGTSFFNCAVKEIDDSNIPKVMGDLLV